MGGMTLALALAMSAGAATDTVVVEGPPRIEIGSSTSDARDQLFDVGRVLRTSDGEFVVVETTAGRLRRYDADGRFVRDLGGRGQGPGEFPDITDAVLRGDTLLVLASDGRVTRLTLEDEVVDTWRPSLDGLVDEAYNPVPAGLLRDGRMLVRANERVFGRPDGDYLQNVLWLTVTRRGGADTLALVPSHRVHSEQGLPRPYRPWVEAAWSAGGGALWLTVPAAARVRRVGSDVRVDVAVPDRAPSDDDLSRFRARYLARGRSANDRRVIAEWVDESPLAEHVPAFRRITADQLGRVWVERWPDADAETTWDVFDAVGRAVAAVRIPLTLRLEGAGDGWIVGVWTDPLGVERVRLYDLPALKD